MSEIICSECQFQNPDGSPFCRRCKFPFNGEWPSLVSQTVKNYRLARRVGGGGFGAVYHAKHKELNNSFAVKILHPKLAQEDQFIEQFQQEAHVLAKLEHEHVVQVIDFGFLEEVGFYLITEWLQGRNLYRIWRRHPTLDRGWLMALFSQLLDALSYAHERGIIHRDLKPENLLLTTGARNRMLLKIVDFGIAKIVEQGTQSKQGEERRSSVAVGTPYYMAPEQVQGLVDRIGPKTDLYACGIILAEMLTGQRVFEAEEQRETMRLHLEAVPPSLKELDPEGNFSDELEQVVQRALAKDPNDRFANAQEFYNALESAMEGMEVEPVWEDIYQINEPGAKPAKRKPRPTIVYRMLRPVEESAPAWPGILLGAVFLCAVVFGGILFLQMSRTPAKVPDEPIASKPKPRVIASGWGKYTLPDRPAPPPPVLRPKKDPADGGDDDDSDDNDSSDSSDDNDTPAVKKRPRRRPPRRVRRRRRRRPRRPVRRRRKAPPPVRERRVAPPPIRRAPTFTFTLRTVPPGGKVYVNGKFIGKTPLPIKGEKGKLLKIQAKMEDKVTYKVNWRVSGNRSLRHVFIEDL